MRKLTKEEFEKYIKDAAEYKFRPNPVFITEDFYKANKEYFDEIGVVYVFEGEPITEEEAFATFIKSMNSYVNKNKEEKE